MVDWAVVAMQDLYEDPPHITKDGQLSIDPAHLEDLRYRLTIQLQDMAGQETVFAERADADVESARQAWRLIRLEAKAAEMKRFSTEEKAARAKKAHEDLW